MPKKEAKTKHYSMTEYYLARHSANSIYLKNLKFKHY